MTEHFFSRYNYKIKSVNELYSLIEKRPRKKKIIFCHGVFNVVHPGHIRHLTYDKTKAEKIS